MAQRATAGGNIGSRMPARYFALLCDLLKSRSVDVEAMLRAVRIWPTQVYGPDATLTMRQVEALIGEALRVSGRGDLAFMLGRQIKLSSHEILGYGILTSPTLDYALQLTTRYYRLITPAFRMQYQRGPAQVEITFQPALPLDAQALKFLLEVVIVSAHEQIRSLVGNALPRYDLHVSYPQPPHARHYRDLKGVQVRFEAGHLPGARLVLPSGVAAQALPMADRAALQMAEERCAELLRRTAGAAGLSDWVAMMLRESHEGVPTLAELARLLNQSARTLDRQLAREGTRFLELSKRIRHERACELLRSGIAVTQVAYQLGYRDAANFTRAFRRDGGRSPSEFQRAREAERKGARKA